jgi:hypothetical protein
MRLRILLLLPLIGLLTACLDNTSQHLGLTHEGLKYKQLAEPSEIEKQAGVAALAAWRTADLKDRRALADKLVLGKTLIGKSEKELRDSLGEPLAPKTADGYMDWNAAGIEPTKFVHRCQLSVRVKGDQVSDAYIFEEK